MSSSAVSPDRLALVVHPDPGHRNRLVDLLAGEGLAARGAATAGEALADLAASPAALAVVHISSPGADGWQFCRLLRSVAPAHACVVPVVLVVDEPPDDALVRLGVRAGASDVLHLGAGDDCLRERFRLALSGPPDPRRPRVLVVAPEADHGGMALGFLEEHGYCVDASACTEAARAALATNVYDLAVLDHELPDEPGDALLESLRIAQPDCICVVIAEEPTMDDCLGWLARGAAAHLGKPVAGPGLLALFQQIREERCGLLAASSPAFPADTGEQCCHESVMEARLRLLRRAGKQSADELLRDIANEAEGLTGSRFGLYYSVDPGDRCVPLLQARSVSADRAEWEPGASEPFLASTVAECVRDRRPVVGRRAVQQTPAASPGPARALAVPVVRNGTAVAVLVVGDKPGEYGERDMEAVSVFADLAWDIAQRSRTAEALRASEADFRTFFDSMGDMILAMSPTGSILAANSIHRDALGYEPGELVGMDILDLHPRDLRAEARGVVAAVLAGDRESSGLPLLAADGREVPAETRFWSGTWDGAPCVFAACRDQSGAHEARRNFRRLFMAVPAPMALSSAATQRFQDVNDAFQDLTGYTQEEVTGRTPQELGLFASPDRVPEILRQFRSAGRIQDTEMQIVSKDGTRHDGLFFGEFIHEEGADCLLTIMVDITDRKRSEERLQSILRAAPAGIGLARDRVLVEVNQRVCELTGYRAEELVGRDSRILYPTQEEYDAVGREIYQMGAAIERRETVSRWRCKDGSVLDVQLASSLLCPGDPSQGLTFAVLDITQSRRAEEELRLSQQRLRMFIDASPDLYFLKDRELRYLLLNRANADFFGRSEEEIVGRIDADLMPPRAAARCAVSDRRAMSENRAVVSMEETGGRYFETRKIPVVIDGETRGVAGLIRDITEKREADQTMRRFRTILETAGFGIAIATVEGVLTYVNPSFAAVHGYEPEDLNGRSLATLLDGDGEEVLRETLATLKEKGAFDAREMMHCRRDGTRFTMLAAGCLVADVEDGPQHVALTAMDISQRKLLEAQLQHTQRMDSVGRLAGGVAHDFNNMLGAILGYAELALEQVDPGVPLYADLREIFEAAERSSGLVRQLLTFARKQEAAPRLLDLNSSIGSMVKMLGRMVGEDIELVWRPSPVVGPVRMDPVQLDQVLANLCVNARDAIAGIGSITIRTWRTTIDETSRATFPEAASGDYAVVHVSDNGTGMSEETMEHLFEPFFTTKSEDSGTGLGLSTVYGIVKQNGGFIHVESALGSGSSFAVHLPTCAPDPASRPALSKRSAIPHGSGTVLLVEDEVLFLRVVESMLRHAGYDVLTADGPEAAIRLAKENAAGIDLLLTDVIMPGMAGNDLATEIRAMNPDLRCLFMSGYGDSVVGEYGVYDTELHFIQKPFSTHDLAARVRKLLGAG